MNFLIIKILSMKYAGFKDAHVNFFIACFSAEVSFFAKVSLVFK